MAVDVVDDAVIDILAGQRLVEQGCANADGGGAGNKNLDRVARSRDAALSDDRHAMFARHFVHLLHFQQSDRLDRGSCLARSGCGRCTGGWLGSQTA